MTICEKVNKAAAEAKLRPGEPDLQDFPTYVKILDEIVVAREKVLAEIKRIDEQYRQDKKEHMPQFERDDLETLEHSGHSAIVSKYGLKVCHAAVLRELANALDYKCGVSFHIMESIIAGKNSNGDKSHVSRLRKCDENGGCLAKKCEYRVEAHV